MIRRLLLLLALSAFAAAPAAQGATSVTLVFTSYTTITKTHDKPPRGKANAGDKIEFKDLLVTTSNQLGKKKGKPVGYDAGTVIYTSPTTQEIEGVTTFPGYGTVTFGGAMKPMKCASMGSLVTRFGFLMKACQVLMNSSLIGDLMDMK